MTKPPLWSAHLHHFCLDTPQIDVVVPWYEAHLEMVSGKLADGVVWLSGRQRNIVFRPADEKAFGYVAYALADADQLARLDAGLAATEYLALEPSNKVTLMLYRWLACDCQNCLLHSDRVTFRCSVALHTDIYRLQQAIAQSNPNLFWLGQAWVVIEVAPAISYQPVEYAPVIHHHHYRRF